jgi:8-oxo-dGTP diphosphatase
LTGGLVPQLCVGAVLVDDERLLLIRRGRGPAQGEWSIPGGRVEGGELIRAAVVREVEEECGIEVVVERELGWVERISDEHHFVIVDYLVTMLDPNQPLRAGDDAAEALWIPLWQVPEIKLVDGLAEFLAEHGIIELVS